MNKHKLTLDELAVESFETHSATGSRGTVFGHESNNTLCEACTNSAGSPYQTACDWSCEFECGGPTGACGTNIGCPPGGGTGTGGGATLDGSCNTGCDMSCEFAC
jgi:hypothetical protein